MKTVVERGDGLQTVIALEDGNLHTGSIQDCTAIAEHAKARQNEGQHGSSEMKLAASLPFVMVERYCNDKRILLSEFMRDRSHIRSMLNDPALAHFRVWPGKV